jgi:putative nucleotidyltransferase with HDIG domain
MRARPKARAWLLATIGAGGGVLLAAVLLRSTDASLATLALLGAAVVLTELFQVPEDDSSLDPGDAHPVSFSSSIHLAAVLIIGPWTGALVAAFGILVVDPLRGSRSRVVAYNASVFALAAAAGGLAFQLAGGAPGALELPADFPALAVLGLAYYAVNNGFMSAIVAFTEERSFWPLARDASKDGLSTAAGEFGLAVAIAFFAVHEPLAMVALAPLMLAAYRSYERLVTLRRETARALETFANVVDERDTSTYRHSARVAEHVRHLAEALRLPAADVARLRWAGRLHDLGKIAVDAAVLRKPGRLDEKDWATMWRHPRLSARLLRRFRFAAEQAKAVEYHHERFDGSGYYEIAPGEIPLSAHFLVVADSYDAMTSDRSYRRGLAPELALAEIEAGSGTQFHPLVAKAFVALQRGQDPLEVLSPTELRELRRFARKGARRHLGQTLTLGPEAVVGGAVIGALSAFGLGAPLLALPILALGLAALALDQLERFRARRLAARIRAALAPSHSARSAFAAVCGSLTGACPLGWAGLVGWHENECRGSLEASFGSAGGPGETALTSWLLREAEATDRVIVATPGELGGGLVHLGVPLRGEQGLHGYLVFAVAGADRRLERALAACAEELALRLSPSAPADRPRLAAIAS